MALERIPKNNSSVPSKPVDFTASTSKQAAPPSDRRVILDDTEGYHSLKTTVHQKLLDRIDLSVIESIAPEQLKDEIRKLVERLLHEEGAVVNELERQQLVADIQHEILGLGPLEVLLADDTVSDILINNYRQVYVERRGKLELTDVRFSSQAHLMKIIDKIVSRIGRRVDESSPMVDARLPDGSRVNAIIPPLALDGAVVSIRKFASVPLKMDNLISNLSITPAMAELLSGVVFCGGNILISGGTGSGKTTLLNILSSYIPADERIVTIEDAAELQLQQPHVVRLETRPPNIEGKGEVSIRALVKNSLRMRPDRIIIGEVRSAEVLDMLQAMNTGHDGSMATVHANTPRDAVIRLENMIGMGGLSLPAKAIRQQISSAIHFIVQANRLSDGKRKILSITEITGMEGETVTMQEIFSFNQTGMNAQGKIEGYFAPTGIRPKIAERLLANGIQLHEDLFNPNVRVEV